MAYIAKAIKKRVILNRMSIGVVFLFLFSRPSIALDISEHSQITQIAFQKYEQCVDSDFGSLVKRILVASNLEEDVNLPLKWAMYSHFYNPYKEIKSYRYGSLARVAIEQNRILKEKSLNDRAWETEFKIRRLGHILHHIQDATSPAHVVPVQHWLNESYETLSETKDPFYSSLIDYLSNSPSDCSFLFFPVMLPTEILKQTAIETHNSLKEPFDYLINNELKQGDWSLFWQESEEDYGQYGILGNKFGAVDFNLEDGSRVQISEDTYFKFRLNGALRALHASILALHWFYEDLYSNNQKAPLSNPL